MPLLRFRQLGIASRAWSCASPSRPGSTHSRRSRSQTRQPSVGRPAKSAAPAPSRCASRPRAEAFAAVLVDCRRRDAVPAGRGIPRAHPGGNPIFVRSVFDARNVHRMQSEQPEEREAGPLSSAGVHAHEHRHPELPRGGADAPGTRAYARDRAPGPGNRQGGRAFPVQRRFDLRRARPDRGIFPVQPGDLDFIGSGPCLFLRPHHRRGHRVREAAGFRGLDHAGGRDL